MSKNYQNFEGLRVATLLTFISGFIDAYTFITQKGRFASMQTGNLLYMMIKFSNGHFKEALSFLIPILFFIVGQFFYYFLRKWVTHKNLRWHKLSAYVLFVLLVIIAILSPIVPSIFTISALAFFASLQLATFKRVRGYTYTNTMMTGNIKNASYLLLKGKIEANKSIIRQGVYIVLVIIAFMLGVMSSTILCRYLNESSLYFLLAPMAILIYFLNIEKPPRKT
ncbi:YoaK family protein [Streptococcus macacae]|uniref:Membrane protein n=1 Tax=Streptococcus macacae NCTC 11558 TaxID=764298 RepID=G5JXJ6_9STRE|nr:YoaK family protein [Streptococcus macacae]EHJ53360.1 putative membrane protein [Streptococcus macacae NCTC 11558]SUN79775.1 permease [Streptococcus macacae NCTC 11558]